MNISGVQVADPDLVDHVAGALAASGLAPDQLVLEMAESVLVADPTVAADRLHGLRALGVQTAIDDFGTGYSSLSYLRQFAVDTLKIDRTFVSGISEHAGLSPLIRGLLDLGRTLGLSVVAEGIEHPDQLEHLLAGGCVLGQGFLYCRPLSESDAGAVAAGAAQVNQRGRIEPVVG